MTTGGNMMKLGGSELVVSRLGIGAMTWGDISMSPRFNPARFAYGPGAKDSEQANENAGALSFVLTSAEEDALNRAAMKR